MGSLAALGAKLPPPPLFWDGGTAAAEEWKELGKRGVVRLFILGII